MHGGSARSRYNHPKRIASSRQAQGDAARIGGVGLQMIRDRVLRFNVAGPDGLLDRKRPGKTPILDQSHRHALVATGDTPARSNRLRARRTARSRSRRQCDM